MFKNFDELLEYVIEFRHSLHRNPELKWEEVDTAAAIRAILKENKIPFKTYANTGTVGVLAANKPGPNIGLRGDIDALQLEEKTEVEYRSQRPGCMHACGHDGHTATLMAAALWLKQHEALLPNPVSLVFQPAEEGGHGALRMIEEGGIKGIDMIFGWHNWPAIKFGQAVCPNGTVMAGNGTFHIDIKGSGGHSSQPELCQDPILASSAITMALQQIVSRRVSPQNSAVVSVTSVDGKSDLTTIPDNVKIEGNIRVLTDALKTFVFDQIKEIAQSTAKAYNVEVDIEFRDRYGATINHTEQAQNMREALAVELGDDWESDVPTPIMASEDYSYYLNAIPGAFALVGSRDGEVKHSKPCHSVHYDFNDKLIGPVSKTLMRLAGYKGEF